MGAGSFAGTPPSLPSPAPIAKVGPTGTNEYNTPGSTGTRFNPSTGKMEVFDLNTNQVYETYNIDPGSRKKTTHTSNYPLKPYSGTIPDVSGAAGPPMVPTWGMEPDKIVATHLGQLEEFKKQEQIRKEEMERARQAEMLYNI